jgi:hypothetical protein
MLIASAIFLASCTDSSDSAKQNEVTPIASVTSAPSPAPEFVWNKAELFEVNIENEFIQSLGYENFESDDFTAADGGGNNRPFSVKPAECEATVIVDQSLDLQAASVQGHSRTSGSIMEFIFYKSSGPQVIRGSPGTLLRFCNTKRYMQGLHHIPR